MCQLNGRFGWSVALVDMNADGHLDVAVGAPSDDSTQLQYHGSIYIYLAQSAGAQLSSQPNLIIRCTVSPSSVLYRAAVGIEFQFTYPSHSHRKNPWEFPQNSHTHRTPKSSVLNNATSAGLGSEASHDERDIRCGGQYSDNRPIDIELAEEAKESEVPRPPASYIYHKKYFRL